MRKPYIGITGFMCKEEVARVLESMPEKYDRLLMLGVLASSKTLRGIPVRRQNRYPAVGQIAPIFPNDQRVLNLIHYHTEDADSLYTQLSEMAAFGGAYLNGFQLNLAWPPPEALCRYKKEHPGDTLVLQVGNRALDMIGHSATELAKKIFSEYAHLVDYVLLDQSGGTGTALSPQIILEYLTHLSLLSCPLGLGVAGGLSPETLNLLNPFSRYLKWLSIDAEGGLRTEDDRLDIIKAQKYLHQTQILLQNT